MLRQTKDSSSGVESIGNEITRTSLDLAKRPLDSGASAEQSTLDSESKSAPAQSADILLSHKTSTGKTLLEAADYFGGNSDQSMRDGSINDKDISALLDADKKGLVKISAENRASLQKIVDGWNKDSDVIALKQMSELDQLIGKRTMTRDYINVETLKEASGQIDHAEQNSRTEQLQKLDQASVQTRSEAAMLAKQLQELKLGKNSLFVAADIAGATRDGEVDQSKVDKKINDTDLKKLASAIQLQEGTDSDSYKLVQKLIREWNNPAVKALRGGKDYITHESMAALPLS